MNLRKLFRRTDTSSAARQLAFAGVEHNRARIRARVDEMRAAMNMEPVKWPK